MEGHAFWDLLQLRQERRLGEVRDLLDGTDQSLDVRGPMRRIEISDHRRVEGRAKQLVFRPLASAAARVIGFTHYEKIHLIQRALGCTSQERVCGSWCTS